MSASVHDGIPCRICAWARWRVRVERYVLRNRAGEAVRRRDGRRVVRERVIDDALTYCDEGWCCRSCVARFELEEFELEEAF